MTAIPAKAAGVGEVVVACPRPDAVVMAAALEAGVSRLFRVGGAHAVAALAYGTATVPRVDKIVGPGNRFVAAAKALVAADCGIDFYAGPTEIVIVAAKGPAGVDCRGPDRAGRARPRRARRADHAERGAGRPTSRVHVQARMPDERPGAGVDRACTAARSSRNRWLKRSTLANEAAAEHLVVDDDRVAAKIRRAGSLFVGPWSAQVAGDYAIGCNHVLPTAGAARVRGGLSAADFVRQITVQRVTKKGLAAVGPSVMTLALAEGLVAHAASIAVRLHSAERTKDQGRQEPRTRLKEATRREATRDARRNSTAAPRRPTSAARWRSTARAATTSAPASASSTTCWSCSRGMAAST